jgi:hypothetical protein
MTDQKTIAAALAAPFKPEELKSRPGRGGNTFTYVDARSVAQRLDDVLGIDGWQFEVQVADLAKHVVKGTLTAVVGGKSVQHIPERPFRWGIITLGLAMTIVFFLRI